MTNFQNPAGRPDAGCAQAGPGAVADAASGATDRGRRLRRAVRHQPPPTAGQGLRHRRLGAALRLVLQMPGAGLPRRLGRWRALQRPGATAEDDGLAGHRAAAATGAGRVPGARRLRAAPARPARGAGHPTPARVAAGGAPLPGRHTRHAAGRRLLPVAGAAAPGRRAGPVPPCAGRVHQHRPRPAVLGRRALSPPPAAERRPPRRPRASRKRCGAWANWPPAWPHSRNPRPDRKHENHHLGAPRRERGQCRPGQRRTGPDPADAARHGPGRAMGQAPWTGGRPACSARTTRVRWRPPAPVATAGACRPTSSKACTSS